MSATLSTSAPALPDLAVKEEHGIMCTSAGLAARGAGFLSLEGPEVLDFLHRLSTNDLKSLKEGSFRATVLTTEKGRMIDLIHVLNMGERVILVTGEGHAQGVKSWLEKYIIMEDITIRDLTAGYRRISIIGPAAFSIMNDIPGSNLSGSDPSAIASLETGGLLFYRNPEWPLPVIDLIGPVPSIESEAYRLTSKSAVGPDAPHARAVGPLALEIIRVESGVSRFDEEINDRLNPLEAGLGSFVSFTKGCYIGQEVIARLDTYKKLQRSIRGFIFPDRCENLSPGALFSQGAEVGWTTTHVFSFLLGRQVALGYLKLIPGNVEVRFSRPGSTEEIPVTVVDLPFAASSRGGSPTP